MPGIKKQKSLSSTCGQEAVHVLISLMGEHPDLYSVGVTSERNLSPQCKKLFDGVMKKMRMQFNRADLDDHLVWRCWYNLRSTYMRGVSSARWAPHLNFLRTCRTELARKQASRRSREPQETTPEPLIDVETPISTPIVQAPFHTPNVGCVPTHEGPHFGPLESESSFFREQFQEDWMKIAGSKGGHARLRSVQRKILEIISVVCDKYEEQQRADQTPS
ncbi:hypothetical protein QR680_016924 [Steinernema hermaphroditum]|uniref:MADF domain-containing protein n=1 Tax=Steinernema hermaphroditum TaxID=289476 RepID=A0AA39HDV8_9BILA|nr:hypothetical protein QR680_016924 [Steinernema hermaphroditum]